MFRVCAVTYVRHVVGLLLHGEPPVLLCGDWRHALLVLFKIHLRPKKNVYIFM